jgi:hypothetical protein
MFRHPRICFAGFRTSSPKALNSRLTLFLQPNHGFGESFRGSGQGHPQHFFQSNAALEPAGRLPKALDQGLGAIYFGHPRLDVAQPGETSLACLLAQGRLRILQFPK